MARRSLRPQLNQIRAWVQQGRTDAWIAHQLEVTVQQIGTFKRENELTTDAPGEDAGPSPTDFDDEIDLRAQDDELIAAELEKAEAERADREAAEAEESARKQAEEPDEPEPEPEAEAAEEKPKRRGRRGGRGRSARGKSMGALEAVFDHGEDGYGLWLDPEVTDNAVYAEFWAGHRPVTVTIEEDQIVIRRAGEDAPAEDAAPAD